MKLGVFTVSTPDWDPLDTLEELAAIGYDGVEWRVTQDTGDTSNPTFWSGNRCSMSAEDIIERAEELKLVAQKFEIEMPSLGAYISCDDLEQVDLHLKACAALGARNVRVGPGGYDNNGKYWDRFSQLRETYAKIAKMAASYGVRALIETHMGQMGPTVHKARAILEGLDPAAVGIMWDPGNQVLEGREVPRMAVEIAGEYLGEVHVKNLRWIPGEMKDGRREWSCASCPLREGIVDWPAYIQVLKDVGYDGWLFFEDFSTEQPTVERITDNLQWFRELLAD